MVACATAVVSRGTAGMLSSESLNSLTVVCVFSQVPLLGILSLSDGVEEQPKNSISAEESGFTGWG